MHGAVIALVVRCARVNSSSACAIDKAAANGQRSVGRAYFARLLLPIRIHSEYRSLMTSFTRFGAVHLHVSPQFRCVLQLLTYLPYARELPCIFTSGRPIVNR